MVQGLSDFWAGGLSDMFPLSDDVAVTEEEGDVEEAQESELYG